MHAASPPAPTPKRFEPIVNAPTVVLALVGALLACHGAYEFAPEGWQDAALRDLAFLPARLTLHFWPQRLGVILAQVNVDPAALVQASILRHFKVLDEGAKYCTLLSYAFVHASWAHVGLNSIWIIAFGPPVARRIGAARFLALFAATAVAGALAHWLASPMDALPLVGASAADSGIMAGAARFVFQPGAALADRDGASRFGANSRDDVAAPPLFELLRNRRALGFVVIWMATNFVFGAGAQSLGVSDAPVAWIAHIGGFLAGLTLFPAFDRRAPR